LRAKVGERSERIVARNQPAKNAMVRVEAGLQEGMPQRLVRPMKIGSFEPPDISSKHPFNAPGYPPLRVA
jgi:hypothetical protein